MIASDSLSSFFPGLTMARRARDVTTLLVRFGFGEFVELSGLVRILGTKKAKAAAAERLEQPLPERVRLLLEELGPTFIKTGQILSTRPDLLPEEWTEELEKLQSDVPPAKWEGEQGVKALLEAEYEDRLDKTFASIEPVPLAAASMAQVHRARLVSGESVVIKVLRPGIREKVAGDLDLMRAFARVTRGYLESVGFDVDEVIDEFGEQLERETDLRLEGRSTRRMRQSFEDHEGITFPKVYTEASTRSVLVLEEIRGTLLSRLDFTTLSADQRTRLAQNGADMVFRQCLLEGFFHADPHPGNVFVLENERLCFIDCGMTGVIDPGTVRILAQLLSGIMRKDLDSVVHAAIVLGDASSEIGEGRAFRADVWQLIDASQADSIESLHVGELLNQLFLVLRKHELRCPADIMYLIKALTTIEGVAHSVAPDFDIVAHVQPYVETLIRQRYGFKAIKERFEATAVAYGDLAEELPGQLKDLFRTLRRRNLSLQVEHKGLDQVTNELARSSMNVAWSLVISAIIVSSAVLVLADTLDGSPSALSVFATLGLGVAMGAGLLRLFISWRGRS